MRKIDDSNIYLYFGIVTIVVTIFLGTFSYYSILKVEPEVKKLLESKENINVNFKKAYIIVRESFIFSRLEFFDSSRSLSSVFDRAIDLNIESKEKLTELKNNTFPGEVVEDQIIRLDKKLYDKNEFTIVEKRYIETLLDRREKGARLGRTTMFFFLVASILFWIMFFVEKKENS
jgi:hypothetical protein